MSMCRPRKTIHAIVIYPCSEGWDPPPCNVLAQTAIISVDWSLDGQAVWKVYPPVKRQITELSRRPIAIYHPLTDSLVGQMRHTAALIRRAVEVAVPLLRNRVQCTSTYSERD
jgi:hypothetical protein